VLNGVAGLDTRWPFLTRLQWPDSSGSWMAILAGTWLEQIGLVFEWLKQHSHLKTGPVYALKCTVVWIMIRYSNGSDILDHLKSGHNWCPKVTIWIPK
jgi:hypothetical protein